jgi:transposase InsO family protein
MKKQRKHYTPEEKVAILRRQASWTLQPFPGSLRSAEIDDRGRHGDHSGTGQGAVPGVRPRVISDNGPQFIAKDFKEFIRVSGTTHVRTSPYYPQSNGKIEWWHKSLKGECIRAGTPPSLEDALRLVEG